jgi:hypothetical protein
MPDRWEQVQLINDVLIATYGPWASGWNSAPSGVLDPKNWCCATHSLFPNGYSANNVPQQADRICRAIGEWRNHLQRLADLFEAVELPADKEEVPLAVRKAVARVVTWVIETTHCDDAWYGYLERALSWLLEHLGIDSGQAREIVTAVVAGRFESWIQPEPQELEGVADELALSAASKLDPSRKRE